MLYLTKFAAIIVLPLIPAFFVARWVESWRLQIYLARRFPDENAWERIRPWAWIAVLVIYALGVLILSQKLF